MKITPRKLSKFALLPILLGAAIGLNRSAIAQTWGITPSPNTSTETTETTEAAPTETIQTPKAITPSQKEPAPLVTDLSSFNQYGQIINRTKSMIRDPEATRLAAERNLQIMDVTWEDTARYDNSSVGPNISDMTIQVEHRDPRSGEAALHLMPVIRYPNYSDLTADVPMQQLSVLTGNEKGQDTQPTLLAEVLDDLREYLNEPDSWKGRQKSLLAERDSHVLVSAQAAFLPIPEGGEATFNPVLFNYQSAPEDPAVLTILATREGTSTTIIDNQRDGFDAGRTWGQRLFFNKNGDRASLTGKRLSDFRSEQSTSADTTELPAITATEEEGLNMVMLIQVPLKQKNRSRSGFSVSSDLMMESAPAPMALSRAQSNVEAAVIGHGPVEGPFTEIDDLAIERDPNFPIRVTVQFYKATSNGVVSESDLAEIDEQINKIYEDADYVGSLVTDGRSDRPTEYEGEHQEPEEWWDEFWKHSEQRLNLPQQQALDLLRKLRGE